MKNTAIVSKYIEETDANIPIFLSDVKNFVGENAKMILSRLVKADVIVRCGHGIYYKPEKTIWGDSVPGNDTIIKHKYLDDKNGCIKGYITGARLFNHLGLTTQVPRMTEVVSNEWKGKNKTVTGFGAIVKKPKTKVNNENYLYQQLLDIIENRSNIQVESATSKEILQAFYNDNNLDFTMLYKVGIARGTAKHTMQKAADLILG